MKLHLNKNNFFYFLAAVFVFISTSALSINKEATNNVLGANDVVSNQVDQTEKEFPQNPVLKDNNNFPILSAQGVIAEDLNSGVKLYEKNPNEILLPASTTKIITALVSLDAYKLSEVVEIPLGVNVDGQKMGLFSGEKMKVENLLYGLLVYSANDAAESLAKIYPGGYDAFISAMNDKAKSLFMENTHFENPIGLDGSAQFTTAKDLLRVTEVAMRNDEFAKIVGTKSIRITDETGKFKYDLNNVNELLGTVPGVMGVKTGWTENARENLVTYIERDHHKIIIVVLGSQDRFGETKELINWIFKNYDWQEVRPQ